MKSYHTFAKAFGVSLLLCILSALFVLPQPALAKTNFQGGLSFMAGFPQGEFKDNVDQNGFGIGGEFLYSPSTTPFGIGISLGFMNYGEESRRERFSPNIPEVEVEVKTTNNIVVGHLLFRAQVKQGPIRPYAEGLVGFNYLFTETKIEDVDDEEEIASSTNLDDGVFSYGAGGGVMLKLYTGKTKKAKTWSILLDLRFRYIVGGEAEYLKEGSIKRVNGKVVFDKIQSKTDILTTHLGVAVEF
ncbi:MAG: outer membrane beta-barrel protein [Candidatus Zixiibacteriota bacterium]